jgi:3-hydroxyisobutyrate dehydrogenase-like beta-hydroxyacid dehydrogenase
MTEVIGFIGLGAMGARMARRLMSYGHSLVVTDTREEVLSEFESNGARSVKTARAVADSAETVFLCLPTPQVVEAVAIGDGGVLEGNRIKRVVDLSTTGATTSARIAARLVERQIGHVDSPVSGGLAGAEKGTLSVMASGPRHHFDVVQPLLANFGKVFFLGEKAGAGQTMKLVNNLLSATCLAATSEAVVMAVKAGIDAKVAIDAINSGSGRNSASQDKFPKSIIPRTFDFGFKTGLMYKDVKLCLAEAEAMDIQMWLGSAVKQYWQLVNAEFGPESDFTEIVKIPEEWAGVRVGAKVR